MHLVRYFHYNPVQAGIVTKAKEWEFSDYSDWIGIRRSKLFNNCLMKQYFNNHEKYKKFFCEYEDSQKITNEFKDMFFDADL